MPNTEPIVPSQQLRFAVDRASRDAPVHEGAKQEIRVNRLREPVGDQIQTIIVELVGRKFNDAQGNPVLGWVYVGSLHVDAAEAEHARASGTSIEDLIKGDLGPRCHAVHVGRTEGTTVDVTVEILPRGGEAR